MSLPELETWQEEARRDYRDAISGADEQDEGDEGPWEEEEGWDEEGEGDEASDADLGWHDSLRPGLGRIDDEPDEQSETIIKAGARIGRNAPCPCGSGKKYKKCCLRK